LISSSLHGHFQACVVSPGAPFHLCTQNVSQSTLGGALIGHPLPSLPEV
jgi:hypothetical protein